MKKYNRRITDINIVRFLENFTFKQLKEFRPNLLHVFFAILIIPAQVSAFKVTGGREVIVGSDPHADMVTNVIWQQEFSYVRLMKSPGPKNDHPANINPQDVYRLLAAVKLQSNVKAEPVFTEDALESIAKHVSEALSQALPREDVVVAITSDQGKFIIRDEKATTARIFVKDDQLNIIFGIVDYPFLSAVQGSGYFKPFDIPFRDKPISLKQAIISSDDVKAYDEGRNDWYVVSVASLANIIDVDEDTGTVDRETIEKIVEKITDEKLNAQSTTQPVTTTKTTTPAIDNSYEGRLTKLKSLYQKGLITKEDYQSKKQAILDEL